ncbi:putative cytochrome P450 120 [Mycolicibacterium chubuense]|uniref:Putative cytochrome P450 120 n=1 Tax=Mycolicibacterium chubuense TaxID=1800 RepID=A0A0J6WNN9_MYCCU|nr:putative cytochrome P450 120 [Mycolicibacterium chubuense]SPX99772.1 cytochrome P450 [Mycolicibacterium chubuense]
MFTCGPRFIAACRRRYGSSFTLRVATMGTMVYLTDPADIRTVFAGDARTFHAGEANSILTGLLGESSVLVVDEDAHRDRRRLMLAPFARDAVAAQVPLIAQIAADNIATWPVGRTFPVAPRMSEITLEAILRTVIGASDPVRLAALREVMPRVLNLGPWQSLAIADPDLLRRRPWRRMREAIAEADRLLYSEIADHRADPALAERSDALAMLVRAGGMSDQELRDQLITLLAAGHDTTATGLSWALERLTRTPDVLAEAVRAARDGDDDYLDAVVRETLRIRPVVFDVGRVLTEPVELAGRLLPAGVMAVPGMVWVHTDPQHYPDPLRFDPRRMLGASLSPSTYLPFGGGNRRCLGATFATVEFRVVLGEILRRVELETTTSRGERRRLRHVIFVPHRGARIRVRTRRTTPGGSTGVYRGPQGCPAADAIEPRATTAGTLSTHKDVLMESSELFSHRQAPQVAAPSSSSDEPVQAPVFSDLPSKNHSADSPHR